MDHTLHAYVKLDIASDLVLIDVRGSLTQDSRPSLMEIIQRVRRMGITSHIRVDLGRAAVVESSALAGLRNDLNAVDGGAAHTAGGLPLANGVSLELNPQDVDPAAVLESLDLSEDFVASRDGSGTGPLTRYSDDELLAASDSVFGLLDNPATARPDLLATYDEIGLEISRREDGREAEPA
jgi:hypothetical protein